MKKFWSLTAASLLMLVAMQGSFAQQSSASKKITDSLNGFSLRVPAEAKPQTNRKMSYVARWAKTNKAGKTLWRITVLRQQRLSTTTDMDTYAKSMAKTLKLSSRSHIEISKSYGTLVSNYKAFIIEGKVYDKPAGQDRKLLSTFCQLWVLYTPGSFTTFRFEATSKVQNPTKIWKRIYNSIEITDNKEVLKEAEKAGENAVEFLKTVTAKRIKKILPKSSQNFLLYRHGKVVGWVRVTVKPGRYKGDDGFYVFRWGSIQVGKDNVKLIREEIFIDEKFSAERWFTHSQTGKVGDRNPNNYQVLTRTGLRQGRLIIITAGTDKSFRTYQARLGDTIRVYLNKTVNTLLPRLMDLTKPKTYAFTEYKLETDSFSFRKIIVGTKKRVEVGGKMVDAIRIVDYPDTREKPIISYVDSKGKLLKKVFPSGLTQVSASWDKILAVFKSQSTDPDKTLKVLMKAHLSQKKYLKKSDF